MTAAARAVAREIEDEPTIAKHLSPAMLSTVFTIPQVAKMAGWTPSRMFRHLTTLNEQLGGMLLRNVSRGTERPRWTITLSALQAIAPQWFHDPESLQRQVEWLKAEQDQIRSRVVHLERVTKMQTEKIVALATA